MRVALCQLNTVVGGFIHNVDKICDFLRRAAAEKAELAIFPELCLSSYPPLDLLDRPGFVGANAEALLSLQRQINDIPNAPETIVLGSIMGNPSPKGRAIHNAAVVLHKNETAVFQPKRLLPTYDVFDEARYFEPGKETQLWDSPWGKVGLSVCEDAWYDDTRLGRHLYSSDPAADLKGASFVINISASPFEINKRKRRQQLLAGFVKRIGAPLIYVNQVGANDEILFDGGSLVYSAAGEVLYEMPSFREGIAIIDFAPGKATTVTEVAAWQTGETEKTWDKMFVGSQKPQRTSDAEGDLELLHKALVTGIRDYFRKTGFKRAVVGLSGGIDSAVIASLAAEALGPRNVLGVSMPSQYSSSHSLSDAEALARAIGCEYRVLSLKFVFSALLMELKPAFGGLPPDVTEENIQARMRGVMLMALANKRNGLVLTTGNKSELGVGYCTTYGDMAGALAPLGDVYKTLVYKLALGINKHNPWIPQSTLTKPPSAELRPNQTDQDSLPPYEILDKLLEMHFEGLAEEQELIRAGFAADVVKKILHLVRSSEFKRRQAAPALKVTSKAFGLGRRIPVAKS
ncbi:MAG: NAD+ synthase [Deltaproteobacteria bacterium]|nr:NAD+ synthase [Deltaproteobacteria bacterium]